jgi:hypothetical protein
MIGRGADMGDFVRNSARNCRLARFEKSLDLQAL